MRSVAIEAAIVTEHESGYATLALNNDLLDGLDTDEQKELVKSLLKMARKKLSDDISKCPDGETISISIDQSHNEVVLQLKLLVSPEGQFILLTYFGGEAEPKTPLVIGLRLAINVVATVEEKSF